MPTCEMILGNCEEVMQRLPMVDAVITDPPYLNGDAGIVMGHDGVTRRFSDSVSVGMPWGYSLDWIDIANQLHPLQWIVFSNYKMLGGLLTKLETVAEIGCVFTWCKSNAPRMIRPVPRLDSEFIVWARSAGASCVRMGEFQSMVLNVPMPQAGCFATERLLINGTGKAAHPCQKPLAVVMPFVERVTEPGQIILDPFMGTGTTVEAALILNRNVIGIEIDRDYMDLAMVRTERARKQAHMFTEISTHA
jgi:site-specific DNA-methyltransferase (adenine-specific)